MAASFQEAVVDVLSPRPAGPRPRSGAKGLCLGGGVAANSLLRERFLDACEADGLHGFLPSRADVHRQRRHGRRPPPGGGSRADGPSPLDTGADPNLRLALID